jgi:hypothetical protein
MGNHVFICYSREDDEFVLNLATNLKSRGVPVWLDQWDIPGGADWDLTIDKALDDCAHFLIILSPTSVGSKEVRSELRTVIEANKPIVPILYRSCRIPRQLRLIQYIDFTSLSPDDVAALNAVLAALGKAENTLLGPEEISAPNVELLVPSSSEFNPEITAMKAVIAKAKELEKNLPENPKQLIDTVVIGKFSPNKEVRLIKDKNHIKLAMVEKSQVRKAHELDEGILVGIIGMSSKDFDPWNKVLNRLPDFRAYIDSESVRDGITARSESKKAHLEMSVKGNRIYVRNKGSAEATYIKVFINNVPEEADDWNCFCKGDSTFRKSLRPGQETHRLLAISSDCHRSIDYKITWENEDGSSGKIEEVDFRLF